MKEFLARYLNYIAEYYYEHDSTDNFHNSSWLHVDDEIFNYYSNLDNCLFHYKDDLLEQCGRQEL